jgi:hypothetical protein
MASLSETLERFNRKERNLLVRAILGNKEKPLQLSKGFRCRVAEALEIKAIDENAWWATDYHYDWLAGALAVHLEGEGAVKKPRPNRSSQESSDQPKQRRLVEGNHEDADLIIASDSDLILVEAKAYGAWSNKQMRSKLVSQAGIAAAGIGPNYRED